MKIEATHLDGLRLALRSGRWSIETDQRTEYGGEDTGPMPSELFLWSIAACYGQAVAHVGRKMRAPMDGLRLEVEGQKDREASRFSAVTVTVFAPSCPAPQLEKVAEHAKRICYVTNSISPSLEVRFEVKGLE